MFTSIRTSIGNYLLKRESAGVTRKRSMINLDGAKRIGIIYPLFAIPDYSAVESFVSDLQKERKDVRALGYVQHKELVSRFLPKLSYDFFSQKEVNWYLRPKNNRVNDFILTEFDLLIDLTMGDYLPLKFVAGLSRARCKVGPFSENTMKYHDLMIKVGTTTRMHELIQLIRHYLTIIKQHE